MDQQVRNFPINSFFNAHISSGLAGASSEYDLVGGCFNFEVTQRKSNCIDGFVSGYSLAFGLGNSVRSIDARANSKTACSNLITSPREGKSDFSSSPSLAASGRPNVNLDSLGCGVAASGRPTLGCGVAASGRPNVNLDLSLSIGATESDVTSVTLGSSPIQNSFELAAASLIQNSFELAAASSSSAFQSANEGSTSSKWRDLDLNLPDPDLDRIALSTVSNLSVEHYQEMSADSPGQQQQRKGGIKTCQAPGCHKGARGASGKCISHGGGRRCQKAGCQKGAEGKTIFCKAHGGGRRCEQLGCTKSAEGRTSFCISHGGGRRCSFSGGCNKAARGKSGLCIRHGGGKRCKMDDCTKSAEGLTGLCIGHGGGRRCQYPSGCRKGAQGSTKYCKAHGGGKRCTYPGCSKGAEGSTMYCKGHGGGKRCTFKGGCSKSVHGGTLFCVAHGGGKRCAYLDCTKSARGRTSFCVRHGGGKRCVFAGCDKSAQGRTDFCKAHGGGRRCLWGQEDGAAGVCDKFARGKLGLCAAHTAQVDDIRIHGGNGAKLLLQPSPSPLSNGKGKDIMVDDGTSGGFNGFAFGGLTSGADVSPLQVAPVDQALMWPAAAITEGRVHGGGLMALLRANGGGFGSS